MVVMDDDSQQYRDRVHAASGPSQESELARVTSAPEPNRGQGHWHTPIDKFRSTTSWHSVEDSLGYTPRWAAAPSKALNAIVDKRPEKRIRLDHHPTSSASVETVNPGRDAAMRQEDSMFQASSSYSSSYGHIPATSKDLRSCHNCWDCEDALATIIQDLIELQTELARTRFNDTTTTASTSSTVAGEVTKQGLRYALGWAATEMRNTLKATQGASSAAATSHRSMTSLAGIASNVNAYPYTMRRASIQSQPSHVATLRQDPLQGPPSADQSRLDQHQRNPSDPLRDHFHSSYETLPPILVPNDEMKRTQHHEHSAPGSAQSPQTSSGSSIYGTGQSPMHRPLPSPPGAHFSHSGITPSSHSHVLASQAAHTSHLADLQHQISTKTLALQTLQREHDQLLAAFSRSQIRCNTLDKKSQVSDHEINTLTEEKIRLQQQVDALEAQMDELSKARDDIQRQSSADGAQWRRIVAMSSQLQSKGAEEANLHKAAKDAWGQEREYLERRIQELEATSEIRPAVRREANDGSPCPEGKVGDVVNSQSLQDLRGEVVRLRGRLAELEALLRDVTGETEQIDRAMKAMVNIRARITGHIGDDGESSLG